MELRKFGRITFIPGQKESRYPACSSLFIDDDRKAIVDPGSDEELLKDLASRNKVDALICTHYHEDHIAFNHLFEDSQLWVHDTEAACYRFYSTLVHCYGVDDSPYTKQWRDLLVGEFHYREREVARTLRDGDILDFGRTRATVVHTPGHTVGHCSLHFPDEGILFLADLDLTPFGPWYGDRVSSIDQTISSMERLLKIPADIYITSHEMGIIEGDISGLAQQYLEVIDQRGRKLLEFLEEPRTLDEIAGQWIIYGKAREPLFFFEMGERGMIAKHLDRLISGGGVRERDGRFELR
jgi:hydroxyacylglutathione hydrolase